MRHLPTTPTPRVEREVLLGQRIEDLTEALADHIQRTVRDAPAEPCEESHFWDIPLREWRRILSEWTESGFIVKAHGLDLTRGLGMAIRHFDDETLEGFLRSFEL